MRTGLEDADADTCCDLDGEIFVLAVEAIVDWIAGVAVDVGVFFWTSVPVASVGAGVVPDTAGVCWMLEVLNGIFGPITPVSCSVTGPVE